MVSTKYKYSEFQVAVVTDAAEMKKIFDASGAQVKAINSKSSTLNGVTLTWTNIGLQVLSFDFNAESSEIDVTTVNADVQRAIPGRPKWEASVKMLNGPQVAQHIINNGGNALGVLYVKRSSGAYDELTAAVGLGTASMSREDTGLEMVDVTFYNIGSALPEWR